MSEKGGDSDNEIEEVADEQQINKKRKLSNDSSGETASPSNKKEKVDVDNLFDEEAAESDEDEKNAGSDDDSESDGDNYKYDQFLRPDIEEEDDDDEEESAEKKTRRVELKKLRKKKARITLDEDDELLIREAEEQLNDNESVGSDESDGDAITPMIVETDKIPEKSKIIDAFNENDDDEGSDMGGFIVRDEGDDSDGERDEQQAYRPKPVMRRAGRRDGPTYDQMQEAIEIFGSGYDDFDDEQDLEEDIALDDEEDYEQEDGGVAADGTKYSARDRKAIRKFRSRFERAQLVASFCTDKDEEIRLVDRPERFQFIMKGREEPDEAERSREADWMAGKLAEKIITDRNTKAKYVYEILKTELAPYIVWVLKFVQHDQLDVPFIWTYRRDYLHEVMTRAHLWYLVSLDEKWEALFVLRLRLNQEIQALSDAAEGNAEDDELMQRKMQNNINDLTQKHDDLQERVARAQDEEKEAMDIIDESDEVTQEDRERVRKASEELENLTKLVQECEVELQREQGEMEQLTQRILRKSRFNAERAKEVMRLFPKDRYQQMIENSTDEVELRDIAQYLSLLIQGAEATEDTKTYDEDIDKENENNLSESQNAQLDALFGKDDVDDDEFARTETQTTDNTAKLIATIAQQRKANQQKKKVALTRRDEYAKYKHIANLRQFIDAFTPSASDFGEAMLTNRKIEPPDTLPQTCEEYAQQFVNGKSLKNTAMVMKAAQILVATEMSGEPTIRNRARKLFKSTASVSTRPTPKGIATINPYHEYFGIHYLDRKPLIEFYNNPSDRTMFVKLIEAEKIGLITVTLDPPKKKDENTGELITDIGPFIVTHLQLMQQFLPSLPSHLDPYPGSRSSWDNYRLMILQMCIDKYLIPSFQQEFRRELIRIGRETIIEECASNFEKMLQIGPYRPPNADSREYIRDLLKSCPNRPCYLSVMSIFQTAESNEPMFLAYVNKDGTLRAHDLLPEQASNQKKDRIKQFILDHRPDVIVLNSSGGKISRSNMFLIEKNILREVTEIIENQQKQKQQEREMQGHSGHFDDDDFASYKPSVIMVKDEVACIFKGSHRAKKMFTELEPGGAAAVCLARFVQEPLAEYCNIWTAANATELFGYEAMFLDLHPLKSVLKGVQGMLIRELEYKLIDAVCDIGVDINVAVNNDHKSAMLAFIGGLGLRKADALKHNIRKSVGLVDSRKSLLDKKILGRVVWTNAIGFIRICDVGQDKLLDPLDNTRIHPECYVTYDFAPKICADALEVDNKPTDYFDIVERLMKSVHKELERRMKKYPRWLDLWEKERPTEETFFDEKIKTIDGQEISLTVELNDSLSQLLLDEFALDLAAQGKGQRRKQLLQIKDELRFPWLDMRKSIQSIGINEMFTIMTNETDASLYVGLKIGCTVTEISDSSFYDERTQRYKRRQRAVVKADSGFRGFISVYDLTDDRIDPEHINITDYIQVGVHTNAVVIGVKKDKIQVDLSIKQSHLNTTEAWWMENRATDRYAKDWWLQVKGVSNPLIVFDRFFMEREALVAYKESELQVKKSSEEMNTQMTNVSIQNTQLNAIKQQDFGASSNTNNRKMQMRPVHHPLFANLDYKATEDRLRSEGKGAGEVLIRPSSKGSDYLTITWAFQENWYKHISVEERNKRPGDLTLGQELYIMEPDMKEPYSDLDEIFSRYIEPMNDLVSVMIKHKCFRSGSVEEVEKAMKQELLEKPGRIPYCIRFETNRPGAFVLTWMSLNSNSEVPIKKDLIEVRP